MIDPLIILLGLGIGILVGLTSCGTGILGTPALVILFGIPPTVAVASELMQGAIMKSAGAIKHIYHNTVKFSISIPFIVGGIPGAYFGALFSTAIPEATLCFILGLLLIILSLLLLWETWKESHIKLSTELEIGNKERVLAGLVGIIIGFITGLTSIGTGVMMIVAMLMIFKLSPSSAIGTNLSAGAVILGVGALTHLQMGNTDIWLVFNLLLGSIPGIIIGSHYAVKAPVKSLRIMISFVILLSGLKLII